MNKIYWKLDISDGYSIFKTTELFQLCFKIGSCPMGYPIIITRTSKGNKNNISLCVRSILALNYFTWHYCILHSYIEPRWTDKCSLNAANCKLLNQEHTNVQACIQLPHIMLNRKGNPNNHIFCVSYHSLTVKFWNWKSVEINCLITIEPSIKIVLQITSICL